MPRKSKQGPLKEQFGENAGKPYIRSSLQVLREAYIPLIAGDSDGHFEAIKQATGKEVFFVPSKKRIDVYAPDKDTAEKIVNVLRDLKKVLQSNDKGKTLSTEEVHAAIRRNMPMTKEDEKSLSMHDFPVKPRRPRQAEYMEALTKHPVTFGIGPAGTGKTFLAIAMAVHALTNKLVSKILLTRPLLEADEELGTLPGGAEEKMHGRLVPLLDSLVKIMGRTGYERAKKSEQIEIVPLGQARGRTFDNAFIIIDEAQNTTREQMKMILTRIGEPAIMAVNGDTSQCDLPRNWKTQVQTPSGLNDALDVLSEHFASGAFGIVAFDEDDVVRSGPAKLIVKSYAARDKREKAAIEALQGTRHVPN